MFLRCAPTSSAVRIPAPITDHIVCGVVVPWRNNTVSCDTGTQCSVRSRTPYASSESGTQRTAYIWRSWIFAGA